MGSVTKLRSYRSSMLMNETHRFRVAWLYARTQIWRTEDGALDHLCRIRVALLVSLICFLVPLGGKAVYSLDWSRPFANWLFSDAAPLPFAKCMF